MPIKKAVIKRRVQKPIKTVSKPRVAAKRSVAPKGAPKRTVATKARKPATKRVAPSEYREYDENGFAVGTASAIIAEIICEGGKSRNEINAKVAKKIGGETRNGTERNVPSMVTNIVGKLRERGYKEESTWRMVPPARKGRR